MTWESARDSRNMPRQKGAMAGGYPPDSRVTESSAKPVVYPQVVHSPP
jgi:hypothetical protein